jgi:hypothetical protein
MVDLNEIKHILKKEYNLQGNTCGVSLNPFNFMSKLSELMSIYSDKVAEFEEQIGKGEDFRSYFSDKQRLKEFMALHDEDIDSFYRILRKEELFLNTCLQAFGFKNIIISLDPNTLLDSFDNLDEDSEDEEYK